MLLPPMLPGRLLRRRKRFLADVQLAGREEAVIAWCPNPGRMTSCMGEGWDVWLSEAPPGRKLGWTWELSRSPAGALILVNTSRPNSIVAEALAAGVVPALRGYRQHEREVKVADSRLDFGLDGHDDDPRRCFVEVKSVTLRLDAEAVGGGPTPGLGAFPDAVTDRGRRHLESLAALAAQGHRAVLFFLVGRDDIDRVRPADTVDPAYGETLRRVAAQGVELTAWRCDLSLDEITVHRELPIEL